jgi:acyl-CoA synthetase (NDP forming)
VAVVGASADGTGFAGQSMRVILEHTRPESFYLVNPRREQIEGIACRPTVESIGEPVDLAIITVPAAAVPGCLADCARAGVTAAYVISAGFAETGTDAGRALDDQVRQVLAGSPMRLGGPNGEGIYDLQSDFAFGFSPVLSYSAGLRRRPQPGNVAIVSQSGGAGFGLFSAGLARGLGFSRVISTGNELDVSALDYAEHCLRCDDTDVVFLYVEGFSEPGRVRDLAREALDRDKALVVLKAGRSETTRRAMMSHTGHIAGPHELYSALFESYGIVEVRDGSEALDVMLALSRCPAAAGSRTAIVSASGGSGLWLAETLGDVGVEVATFTAAEQEAAASYLPPGASPRNPVDTTAEGARDPARLIALLTEVLSFDSVDVAFYVAGLTSPRTEVLTERLAPVLAARTTTAKPLLLLGHYYPVAEAIDLLADEKIAWFTSQAGAGRAVAALARRGAALRRQQDCTAPPDPALELRSPECADELALKTWLAAHDFRVPAATLVSSAAAAAAAQERIGVPVAMKLQVAGLAHKSDIGGVALNISTQAEAAATFGRLAALVPDAPPQVLVERMAGPGRELLVGVITDPDLGSFLVLGPGGTDAELGLGTVIWPVPVTLPDARAMIERLAIRPALGPWRGQPARDLDALAALLVRVSDLARASASTVRELEFNPVIVYAEGAGLEIVDALAVPATAGAEEH